MTEQITIKLNKKLFQQLIDSLYEKSGKGLADSNSDLTGKCLFLAWSYAFAKDKTGRTPTELISEAKNSEVGESVVNFMNEYYEFKKMGLKKYARSRGIIL